MTYMAMLEVAVRNHPGILAFARRMRDHGIPVTLDANEVERIRASYWRLVREEIPPAPTEDAT